jgi:hypothetical protein
LWLGRASGLLKRIDQPVHFAIRLHAATSTRSSASRAFDGAEPSDVCGGDGLDAVSASRCAARATDRGPAANRDDGRRPSAALMGVPRLANRLGAAPVGLCRCRSSAAVKRRKRPSVLDCLLK